MPDLPKDGRSYRIWSVVEDLVLDRYDTIQQQRMRDSYYLIREWLETLRNSDDILDAEFDYFEHNYEYYRDDFWPRIEKKHDIRRPKTKPPTTVIENGTEYNESHIPEAWDRSRGFIFVEKSGMAEDLTPLSYHGWLIVAAQGESTRTFREAVANDDTDRPVLAVTDADFYGGGITESLEGHSNRTSHLELWRELEDRVQGIGLTQADADALDLPKERDPTKSPDEWRTELNALIVLQERMGLDVPLLSYVAAKMDQLGIPLCPLPVSDPRAKVRGDIERALHDALSGQVDEAVDQVMDGFSVDQMDLEGTGSLVSLRTRAYDPEQAGGEDLTSDLIQVAQTHHENQYWWKRTRYEQDVKEEIGADDVDNITTELDG